MVRFMQKGDKIWFTPAKDCPGCFTEETLEWGRDKNRAGRMLGDWYNAGGDRGWWCGSDRKSGSGEKHSDPGHIWKVREDFLLDSMWCRRKRKKLGMTPNISV